MMSTIQKKKIKAVQPKKASTISRLIKCYVCNQHFDSQSQFDLHIKHHQNKLNRTNIEQIQRRTQESFNKRKILDALNKTQSITVSQNRQKEMERNKENSVEEYQEALEEKEEKEIEEALRESQIILEQMEFMTQVIPDENENTLKVALEEEREEIEKTIQGQRHLYQLISKAEKGASIEKLIMQTQFEMKYFQNYQEQLAHLRVLASAAVTSQSVAKILAIRKNICRDIVADLQQQFTSIEGKKEVPLKKISNPKLTQNTGELRYCADCYSEIGAMEQLYTLQCGHCYHVSCWNGQCCG